MTIPPNQSVEFDAGGDDRLRAKWSVHVNEDGSLQVYATGVRCGRVLIEPQSNNCVHITTDKIVRKSV